MPTFTDILEMPNGAIFRDADLHVHSFGGSDDVKDPSMTVQAIIDAAVAQGISVLAITDHNSSASTAPALEYSSTYAGDLLVVPGIEITTAHGHLLAYFDPARSDSVRDLLARIQIVGKPGARDSHTRKSMADVIAEAKQMGGICVAAHIDRARTGFESMVAGYPSWKKDILCSAGLLGVEVDDSTNLGWYSEEDDLTPAGAERKKLLRDRGLVPEIPTGQHLAHVQNSDAHTMEDFVGQTSSRTLTKLKMNELSFEAFRTAFSDAAARVRALASVPRSFPRILGVRYEGGFLDGEAYHFSDNLTCFIGGRGAGKSTALEGLAYGTGLRDEFAERGNCPQAVTVYCEDANGVRYRYDRTQEFGVRAFALQGSQEKEVPVEAFRVEFYGQGDIGEVAKDPLAESRLLQEFLDRHVLLNDLVEREIGIREELNQNSAQLIPLESSAAQLSAKDLKVKGINRQLQAAEEGKVKEFAAFQIRLAGEKSLCDSLSEAVDTYGNGLSLSAFLRDYDAIEKSAGELTGGKSSQVLFERARAVVSAANQLVNEYQNAINQELAGKARELAAVLKDVESLHAEFEKRIALKRAELSGKGLSGSIEELSQLIVQRTKLSAEVTRITKQRAQLDALRKRRADLLGELEQVRSEIVQRRKAQLKAINANLQTTIADYSINLYYDPAGITDDYRKLLLNVMHGSFLQEETAELFCELTMPQEVADFVREGNIGGLAVGGLDPEWADELFSRFRVLTQLHLLEAAWKPPRPVIKVLTKTTPPREIPVNQLSDGQKHTIFLTIAMLAESNVPLLIDQPEDDLDNEFISTVVVSTLRAIKQRRQVLIVTHNANIAVLGDSELILPLRREGENGRASRLGSIDSLDTKKQVQQILEGGPLAFRRRMSMYGWGGSSGADKIVRRT